MLVFSTSLVLGDVTFSDLQGKESPKTASTFTRCMYSKGALEVAFYILYRHIFVM